ncbi:hypothetical protein FQA39_LY02816 [Lamprigera yunnana]|nr:hypothetical protein FQA39_LY02816 [Lamprigera yunnana]
MSEGDTFPTSITINPPYEDVHVETDKNSDESDNKAFENVHLLPCRILLSSCSTNIKIVGDAQNVISILKKRSIIATASKQRRIQKELRILDKTKAVNFQVANVPIPEQPNHNVLQKSLLNPIIPFNKFSPGEFLECKKGAEELPGLLSDKYLILIDLRDGSYVFRKYPCQFDNRGLMEDWVSRCKHLIKTESDYLQNEQLIDVRTEKLIISLNGEDSDSDLGIDFENSD